MRNAMPDPGLTAREAPAVPREYMLIDLIKKILPDRHKRLLRRAYNRLAFGSADMFSFVSVETITACNRRCDYCPNSIYDRGLIENKRMLNAELFYKLVDELGRLKFSGIFSPNLYGEPLMDERLELFVKYARDKMPGAKILIYTNGDFLTVDLHNKLSEAGVSQFVVTQHSGGISLNMRSVLEYRGKAAANKANLSYKKLDSINNRGGLVRSGSPVELRSCRYFLPEITVDFEGNVILCCNDYHGSMKFGNIGEQSLMNIWTQPHYRRLREKIRSGVFELEICKLCSTGCGSAPSGGAHPA